MIKEERLLDFAKSKKDNIIAFWFRPSIIVPYPTVHTSNYEIKLQTFYSGSCPTVSDAKDNVEMMLVMQALFGLENEFEVPFGAKEFTFAGLSQFIKYIPEDFETVWSDYFLFSKVKVRCYVLEDHNMKLRYWAPDIEPWGLTHICALKFSL